MNKPRTIRERLGARIRPATSAGLLCVGAPQSGRKIMTADHQLELVDGYPTLYRLAFEPPTPPFSAFALDGFAVGDGWFSIIDRLSATLAADPSVRVGQVKEKNGVLKLHCSGPRELDAVIAAASTESEHTCEICGEPGAIAARLRGWISVRCEACEMLDDMEEACRCLRNYASGDLAAFGADSNAVDASMLAIIHLGNVAARLSPDRRAQFPNVGWSRMESFRAMTGMTGAPSMSAAEIWTFVRDVVPTIEEALR